jgi:starch synthase (maltosyl-transferring)
VEDNTRYVFTVIAWRDLYATWRDEVSKKHAAGVSISLELIEGRNLIEQTLGESDRQSDADAGQMVQLLTEIDGTEAEAGRLALLMSPETAALMKRAGVRTNLSRYERELEVVVDRKTAAFSAWYELMPRSMSDDPNRHGTFDDVIRKLPMCGTWASTCCISRRYIRSAVPIARARTTA